MIAYNDAYRYLGKNISKGKFIKLLLFHPEFTIIFLIRKLQSKTHFKWIYFLLYKYVSYKYHFQIPYTCSIGDGFYIGHFGRIIINPNVILGKNVNIATGITIGQENRGARKGTPIIGDRVWIGTNAVIVGNIKIGDNVLISPNTFVNFDIPNNSIVIGNPAKIIPSSGATEGYINNFVE